MSKEQNDKVRADVTEEQKKAQSEQEQDEQFKAEELEERIAPGQVFGADL